MDACVDSPFLVLLCLLSIRVSGLRKRGFRCCIMRFSYNKYAYLVYPQTYLYFKG